ncbi:MULTISPECIES: hypothetical protein [unclassified Endozoicomonas]|uniref:hypothetical protein n=1 Tax=unclassified Endozoicomonas TaxID=2644528 RepID=UPI002149007E|nr:MULTISPECIES: hypothetical protein [unclassified Endozoicomonas]
MLKSLWQTLIFLTLVVTGTVKGASYPTPSPEPLTIVLGNGSIIVQEDMILSIHGFTPFFDSQKGSVLLISDINEKSIIRLRADAHQSLAVTDLSGHQIHIDLQDLLKNKKAVFAPVDGSIHTEKTGRFFSGITITAKELSSALNGLPTSLLLQNNDYQKGSQQERYSGGLTPGQAIFSLSGLSGHSKSLLPASHGLLGINDKKSLLSEFLDYPVAPTFVEVTAYMNYENYTDAEENVNDTMILLRFLVENSETVGVLYSLLMSAFSTAFLCGPSGDEFSKRFWMKDQYQPLKLEKLYHFLVSRKQSEIDNASQTVEGSTGGASAALPESENAVTAVGYAIARHIRRVFSRSTDEKIKSILEHFLGPELPLQYDEEQLDKLVRVARLLKQHAEERAGGEQSDEDETSSSDSEDDILSNLKDKLNF